MRTTILITCLFTAACGSRSSAPAPEAPAPPSVAAIPPSPVDATPPPPPVDVKARCAELDRPTDDARAAAAVLGTATTDVAAAVTCLAGALDRATVVWGTEQEYDRRFLHEALAGAIESLTGIAISGYDLDKDPDVHALAVQARDWVAHH